MECFPCAVFLRYFCQRISVEQNIMHRLLTDTSTLAREPDFLLREELRDLVPYHAILMSLAEGLTKPTQIAKAVGIDVRAQIDVVGIRRDNWTDLGECRWRSVSSLSVLAAELEDKARHYPNARNAIASGMPSIIHCITDPDAITPTRSLSRIRADTIEAAKGRG